MRLAVAFGVLPTDLRKRLTAREFDELKVADMLGLIPEPWAAAGSITNAVLAAGGGDVNKLPEPSQYGRKKLIPKR